MQRLSLLALALVTYSAVAIGAENGKHPLQGTWRQVSVKYTGEWQDPPPEVTMYKHVTDSHFTWIQFNNQTKQIVAGAGGRCALADDSYVEHIEYVLGPVATLLGKKQEFKWELKDGKWRLFGTLSNGQYIEEIFERVRAEEDDEDEDDEDAEDEDKEDENVADDQEDDN